MTQEYSGDWITARRKINKGKDWRGTANVSIGGQTMEIGHRLLTESEFLDLKRTLPLSELQEYREEDQSEAEQRLEELQQQDDLSPEEADELETLQAKVAAMQDDIEDALGEDAYDKIIWAGKRAVMPTEQDCEDFVNAPPSVQVDIADVTSPNQLPNPMTPGDEEVEQLLKQDMLATIEGCPYPLKFNIGMQAFMESVRVLGNGLTREA